MPTPLNHDPFDTLEAAFTALCAEPRPLALEAGAVVGLPRRAIPTDRAARDPASPIDVACGA